MRKAPGAQGPGADPQTPPTIPGDSRPLAEWAQLIRADLAQAVAGFIAAGQHLAQARQQIGWGRFGAWCQEHVGISYETARRLIAIGQHPALANPTHVGDLPPRWGTLYELSRMNPPQLEAAIARGLVHRDLTRAQAAKLARFEEVADSLVGKLAVVLRENWAVLSEPGRDRIIGALGDLADMARALRLEPDDQANGGGR